MPPPGQLTNNFYYAVLNVSNAVSAHGSSSILIGSAALNAHGMVSRSARVRTYHSMSIQVNAYFVDINLSRFDEQL